MPLSGVTIDLGVIIGVLYAIVAVMVMIVLYHVLFIMVDLRKIVRRFEDMTSQVETVLMKPLSIADQGIQWVVEFFEHKRREHQRKKNHHHVDVGEDEEMDE